MTGRIANVSIVLLLLATGPAMAQNRGTKKEQDACQADVFRVCDEAVPDEKKIVDCLNRKLPELSAACQRLIEPDPKKRTKEF